MNRAVRSDIEYFYQRGTNDIYKLYITSGKLYKQEYDTDNTNTVISQVMSDNGRVLIVKKKLNESQNKEKFCYVIETEDQD